MWLSTNQGSFHTKLGYPCPCPVACFRCLVFVTVVNEELSRGCSELGTDLSMVYPSRWSLRIGSS